MKLFRRSILSFGIGYLGYKNFENKMKLIEIPGTASLLRGEYENKLKQESTIEKIFEVFSTVKRDNQLFLTYKDLIKSIVPFNYTEIDNEKLDLVLKNLKNKYKTPFYTLFDFDKSGDIDVIEYLFFNIIHRIPNNITDYNEKGLNKDEFKEFMRENQKNNNLYLTQSFVLDPRANKISKEDIKKSENKIIDNIFKNKELLSLEDFKNLKNNISEQIYYSEFLMLMNKNELLEKNNLISKDNFCKSIISFIHPNKSKSYLNLVDKINIEDKFDFNDFLNFKKFINEPFIENTFNEYGVITKKKYNKIINKFKFDIKETTKDLVFNIIDIDNNGYIDKDEYLSTIYRIRSLGRNESKKDNNNQLKPFLGLSNTYITLKDKLFRIFEIIKE